MWNKFWGQTFGSETPSFQRGIWLRWLLTIFGLTLLFVTSPLWQSQNEFPQVPWFSWGRPIPSQVDLVLLLAVVTSLIAISATRTDSNENRFCLMAFSASLVSLMLLNQQRAQPWAYQFVLTAVVLAAAPAHRAMGLLRLLTVSIYLHSAVSKLDYSFCNGLGRSFLMELRELLVGTPPAGALPWQAGAWPLLFPVMELIIALGLIWPVSRRWALWGAAGMHMILLAVLGPWGLKHSWGVLVWNGYFVAQNFVLFARERRIPVNLEASRHVTDVTVWRSQTLASVVVAGAALWPCFEPWGYCDLWPAWGLYAQHGEQLNVWVSEGALRRLPVVWQETATRALWSAGESREWQLRPQQVALKTMAAPLYPQNRFQLGVVLELARRADIPPADISAEWFYPANRWTGVRRSQRLNSLVDIAGAADHCWLNARARE